MSNTRPIDFNRDRLADWAEERPILATAAAIGVVVGLVGGGFGIRSGGLNRLIGDLPDTTGHGAEIEPCRTTTWSHLTIETVRESIDPRVAIGYIIESGEYLDYSNAFPETDPINQVGEGICEDNQGVRRVTTGAVHGVQDAILEARAGNLDPFPEYT